MSEQRGLKVGRKCEEVSDRRITRSSRRTRRHGEKNENDMDIELMKNGIYRIINGYIS